MISRIAIASLICALGSGVWVFVSQKPTASAAPVAKLKTERLEITPTRFPVLLKTRGTVMPHHAMMLTAQVPGTVWRVNADFETGAFFKKGDILVELDSSDLQAALTNAESKLAKAEAAYAQEEAKAEQARMNWADLGYAEAPSPLVLRIPQLKEAQANVMAAKADIGLAMRNLDRAKVRAPFDGRIAARNIQPGQSIAANTPLAEIFATDFAEVRLPLTPEQADFVKLPTRENDKPVEVTLVDDFGSHERPSIQTWKACIVRTEAGVNAKTGELFAIARVEDPCGLRNGKPELRVGQPVQADIHGVTLEDVYLIPRKLLQAQHCVYRIDKNSLTLQAVEVTPVWQTEEQLVVRKGFCGGDWIASSDLGKIGAGTAVELVEQTPVAPETEPKIAQRTPDS